MRKPSEKVTVRLFPHNIRYLLVLLDKQCDINSREIARQLRQADLQQDIKHCKWEQEQGFRSQ